MGDREGAILTMVMKDERRGRKG